MFSRVFGTFRLDLELDNCMQSLSYHHKSICQPSLIHFDVKIIEIGALKAEFRFHVSLPRGNTRGISRIIGNVTHAPEDVTEQGLHQQTHVSGRLA